MARKAGFALALLLVVAASWTVREVHATRLTLPEESGWVCYEPDSLYHARRVERALDEGFAVAGTDPYLDWPHGAAIPWPPYYTLVAAALVAPGRPADPVAARGYVERGVATLPFVFALATSLLAALAAWRLAGAAAGLFAGVYHATCLGSVAYSRIGNGDHHAWISMLLTALLLVAARALDRGALERPRAGLRAGVALGALAGLLLGSWVASLVYVGIVQLVLALRLFADARRPRPGLAPLGLAFHATAAAVLLPAVLASPWRERAPWSVVDLSWFHAAYLALGALAFLPRLRLHAGSPAQRRYPWVLAGAVAALAALLFALDAAPARALAEAFAWAERSDVFMAEVRESRPLLGPGSRPGELAQLLGYGAFALPLAWLVALRPALRGAAKWLPWLVALPILALQAALQARFADALAPALAVLVGAAAASRARTPRARVAATALAIPLALLAQIPSVAATWQLARAEGPARNPALRTARGQRALLAWLREHSPTPPDYCVLAPWHLGHAIEWAADRPTVATNFGSYLGPESFADPARFYLAEDEDGAERILERRGARYVLAMAHLASALPSLLAATDVDPTRYLRRTGADSGSLEPAWYRTMAAALLQGGHPRASATAPPAPSIASLRLVHVGRVRDQSGAPAGYVWEHVAGARVEARAEPGTPLAVRVELVYPDAQYRLVFERTARADEDGVARVRVPYATTGPNGDGRILGAARWQLGDANGTLAIEETDVREGHTIRLP